jgi:predicted transposase YdaD
LSFQAANEEVLERAGFYARAEAKAEERATEKSKREIAKSALAKGWSPEEVAEITELDIETVKALYP